MNKKYLFLTIRKSISILQFKYYNGAIKEEASEFPKYSSKIASSAANNSRIQFARFGIILKMFEVFYRQILFLYRSSTCHLWLAFVHS